MGKVFNIQRFSTHDGKGIRTTVFLKGCPLRCVWCQNPEGISVTRRALHFETRCIKCGICVASCKDQGMTLENGKIKLHAEAKEDWEQLVYNCPAGAIEMDSTEMSVEEVVAEIKKDEAFFKHGGGMTISGGEPLLQWEFAADILKKAQEAGIHTAMESSLYAKEEALKVVLAHLDSAFADFKIADDTQHQKLTGVSNERIKKNLKILLESDIKEQVIIRTPMIPGMTDSKENIQAIAGYISSIYPDVTYEILNYNPLAESKYHLVDREFCFEENPKVFSGEKMEEFKSWAIEAGVKKVII